MNIKVRKQNKEYIGTIKRNNNNVVHEVISFSEKDVIDLLKILVSFEMEKRGF